MADNAWLLAQGVQAAQILVETMGMMLNDLRCSTMSNGGCSGWYTEEAYVEKARQLGNIYMDIMQNR